MNSLKMTENQAAEALGTYLVRNALHRSRAYLSDGNNWENQSVMIAPYQIVLEFLIVETCYVATYIGDRYSKRHGGLSAFFDELAAVCCRVLRRGGANLQKTLTLSRAALVAMYFMHGRKAHARRNFRERRKVPKRP
jgi:hypothetical protein